MRITVVIALAASAVLAAVSLADLPAPIAVRVQGRPVQLPAGTTLSGAVRSLGLRPRPGRLLAVDGRVLLPRANPGRVYLNGATAAPGTVLRDGDRITVVDGPDEVEGVVRRARLLPGRRPGNPRSTLRTWRLREVRLVGRFSGALVSVRFVPVGRAARPPRVALTFDDGPWPGTTRAILRILRRMHVRATFFLVGSRVERSPRLVRAIARGGHAIGNHSWSHPMHPAFRRLPPERLRAELARTNRALERLGVEPALFRPPGGSVDGRVVAAALELGMRTVLWDVDPRDWAGDARPAALAASVLRQVRPGSIVLLHDGGGDGWTTVRALPAIVRGIRRMGLRLVPLR
ncbi:MAG TPA: polysaccharide deacetylase family protein [Actinomycetota bacterium]|nr:polysaccharide deacetylase family protein [Actinomycetota bacterium]